MNLDLLSNLVVGPFDKEIDGIWVLKTKNVLVKRWQKQFGYISESDLRKNVKREFPKAYLEGMGVTADEALELLIKMDF